MLPCYHFLGMKCGFPIRPSSIDSRSVPLLLNESEAPHYAFRPRVGKGHFVIIPDVDKADLGLILSDQTFD